MRSLRKILTAGVAALGLLFLTVPPVAAASDGGGGDFALSGVLTLPDGITAAPGITVCAIGLGQSDYPPCQVTDGSGAFEITTASNKLVATSYRLYASDRSFPTTYFTTTGSSTDRDDAAVLDLSVKESWTGLNFSLAAGTGVVGSVGLSDAADATEIEVEVTSIAGAHFGSVMLTGSGTQDFAFRKLPAGTYTLTFDAVGYSPVQRQVQVNEGLFSLEPVTLAKSETGSIAGTVIGTDGTALTGVTVTAVEVRSDVVGATTTTDAEGGFTLASLAGDTAWILTFTQTGYAQTSRIQQVASGANLNVGQIRLAAAATITVAVRNTGDEAVSGATLTLTTPDGSPVTATEDTGGRYTFSNLTPGRYVLEASAPGYLGAFYPGVADRSAATVVRVGEGATVDAGTFTMTAPATITGTIASSDASVGISSVNALLYDADGAFVTSDNRSSFTMPGLWPGEYTIRATSARMVDGEKVAVTLEEGETTSVGPLTLSPNPKVNGSVTVGGAGVDNARVTLTSPNVSSFAADTDASGAFKLWIPADTYTVAVAVDQAQVCGPQTSQSCTPATITVPADAASVDLNVALTSLGTVKTTVNLGAMPYANSLGVSVFDAQEREVAGWSTGVSPQVSLTRRLAAGTYTVVATVDDTWTQRSLATIANGETTAVNLTMVKTAVPTYSIRGTLKLPQFESNVTITAVDADSNEAAGSVTLSGLAAGAYAYKIPNLKPRTYKLHVTTGDTDLWFPNTQDPRLADAINLRDGSLSGVELRVAPTRITVSGTVALPNGVTKPAGVPYPTLTLLPTSQQYDPTVVTPDATGAFSVAVPAGSYTVMADKSDALGTLRSFGNERVFDADTSGVDITLVQGGGLNGRVRGADGIPIADAEVTVSGDAGDEYALTDADGLWHLDGLKPGSVGIKAEADGFVADVASSDPTVVAGQSTDTGTITLTPTGRLNVRLVAGAQDDAKTGVTMMVTDASGKTLLTQTMAPDSRIRQISGLPANTALKIGFRGGSIATQWWQGAASAAAATPVTLNSDSATTIAPALSFHSVRGTISGHITDNTGTGGHITVSALPSGGTDSVTVDTNAQGDFSLSVLPGSYFVQANLCTGTWNADSETPCVGKTRTLWILNGSGSGAKLTEVGSGQRITGADLTFQKWEFASAPAPKVSGTAQEGNTLTSTIGAWGPTPVALAYQWYRNGVAIDGATGTSYLVTSADRGSGITLKVTGSKFGYQTLVKSSAEMLVPMDVRSATPRILGTAKVGYRLAVTAGAWAPSRVSLSYQWYASGVAIGGATGSSFLLTPAQLGKRISVTVTGSFVDSVVSQASTATAAVAAGTLSAKTPAIAGTAKVGKKLKAKSAAWGPAPVTLRYQWYANGKKISKATKSSYKIAKKYKGKKITVTVTGSKAGYTTVAKKSKATKRVK